jgi:hypothetical protein
MARGTPDRAAGRLADHNHLSGSGGWDVVDNLFKLR